MTRLGPDPTTLDVADFPVRDTQDYRIVMDETAYRALIEHAREDTSVELCGVLVGRPARDEQGSFLHIRHIIRGEKAASAGANVTFTHQTWELINRELDTRYPDLRNVGWYHTHPGFGVFLSGMDEFIQTSTFNDPTHVAFVIDPKTGDEGFFVWKGDKPAPMPHYWVGESLRYSSPPPAPITPAPAPSAEPERKPSDLLDFRFLLVPRYYVTVLMWAAMCATTYYLMASCMGPPGARQASLQAERMELLRDLVAETLRESGAPTSPPLLDELDLVVRAEAERTLGHRPLMSDDRRAEARDSLKPVAARVFLRMAQRRLEAAEKADKPETMRAEAKFWEDLAVKLIPELKPKDDGTERKN